MSDDLAACREAHNSAVLLATRHALTIMKLRWALMKARPFLQIEAARHAGRAGWIVPAKDALAEIDAALAGGDEG